MFAPLRGLWWRYSCFDFETYGATINAAWAFCLLWLPVKSQSMRQEVRARQYQPMISWERKWVVLNVPKIPFMKWTTRGNNTDIWHKFLYVNISIRKTTRLDVVWIVVVVVWILCPPIKTTSPFRHSVILKLHIGSICCRAITLNHTQIAFCCISIAPIESHRQKLKHSWKINKLTDHYRCLFNQRVGW